MGPCWSHRVARCGQPEELHQESTGLEEGEGIDCRDEAERDAKGAPTGRPFHPSYPFSLRSELPALPSSGTASKAAAVRLQTSTCASRSCGLRLSPSRAM